MSGWFRDLHARCTGSSPRNAACLPARLQEPPMLNKGRPLAHELCKVELPRSATERRAHMAAETSWTGIGDPQELGIDQPTQAVLLLFLHDTDRWWTAGAMTRVVTRARDTI